MKKYKNKSDKMDVTGIKPRTPKQIARAGTTLAMGMAFLPFIPYTKKGIAKTYSPNPGYKKKNGR